MSQTCRTDGCTNAAEARDFFCIACHLKGKAPLIKDRPRRSVKPVARVQLLPYEGTCLSAGHQWSGRITRQLGELLRITGATCGVCGSFMEVNPVLIGSIGTITAADVLRRGREKALLA